MPVAAHMASPNRTQCPAGIHDSVRDTPRGHPTWASNGRLFLDVVHRAPLRCIRPRQICCGVRPLRIRPAATGCLPRQRISVARIKGLLNKLIRGIVQPVGGSSATIADLYFSSRTSYMRPFQTAALGAVMFAAIAIPLAPAAASHTSRLCLCTEWATVPIIVVRDGVPRVTGSRTRCLRTRCFTVPSAFDLKSLVVPPPPDPPPLNPKINPQIHK